MGTGDSGRLRVAVVGLRMGAAMLDALAAHPRAEVVALCDPAEERVRPLAERHGIDRLYGDYGEMLAAEDLDGVCISTPNRLHTPMVRAALERRLHVMCEKPLTLDTGEARQLVAEARAIGVTNATNFSNRPNPAVNYMKAQIDAGVLGRIYEVHLAYLQDWLSDPAAPHTWRNSLAESGSGALGDIGSHVLDLGRLFAGEVASVSAHLGVVTPERLDAEGVARTVDADDLAYLQLRFAGGAHGALASLVLEIDTGVSRVLRADEPTAWRGDGFREVFATDTRQPSWGGNVLEWVDAALERREMSPSFEDGLRCQEILDAAIRSHAERRWIDLWT